MGDLCEYFSRSEFECSCGCGFDTVDIETLKVLEDVRHHFGRPVVINSACRCSSYNKEIGGSNKSQHVLGRAVDIVVSGIDACDVSNYLEHTYPHKYGIGVYPNFTHIDTRKKRARWS